MFFGRSQKIKQLEEENQTLQQELDILRKQKEAFNAEAAEYRNKFEELNSWFLSNNFSDRIEQLEAELQKATEEKDSAFLVLQTQKKEKEELQIAFQKFKDDSSRAENEYINLREIYKKKLSEMEEAAEDHTRKLVHEAVTAREELSAELDDARQAQYDRIASDLQSFQENYQYYFNQISQMMTALNLAAINTCSAFLTPKDHSVDITASFDAELTDAISSFDGLKLDVHESTATPSISSKDISESVQTIKETLDSIDES